MVYGEILLMMTSRIPTFTATTLSFTPVFRLFSPWPMIAVYTFSLAVVVAAMRVLVGRIEKEETIMSEEFRDE